MKVKVFTLPWRPEAGGFDDGALQAFLQERIVLELTEHFFTARLTAVDARLSTAEAL